MKTNETKQASGNKVLTASQEEKGTHKPSASYTIKSMKGVISKLIELKMITDEEAKQLKEIHKTVMHRWIGLEIEKA